MRASPLRALLALLVFCGLLAALSRPLGSAPALGPLLDPARDARDALARGFATPAQHFVVADRQGTIGLRSTGRFPVRPGNGSVLAVDAAAGRFESVARTMGAIFSRGPAPLIVLTLLVPLLLGLTGAELGRWLRVHIGGTPATETRG
ncbi:MAG: penicillin acylase family protein [Gemmatimonadaceae bacterium]